MSEWQIFPDFEPEESGVYDVVVQRENGAHVETAEYSKAKNAFLWYSRRGYPYQIIVSHWRPIPPLPIMEKDNDTISS